MGCQNDRLSGESVDFIQTSYGFLEHRVKLCHDIDQEGRIRQVKDKRKNFRMLAREIPPIKPGEDSSINPVDNIWGDVDACGTPEKIVRN